MASEITKFGPAGQCKHGMHNGCRECHKPDKPPADLPDSYPQKSVIEAGPHGWIQWKGTDVCMDIRCGCGELHHLDADFAYYIHTPCGRLYKTESEVVLTPVESVPNGSCEAREAEA